MTFTATQKAAKRAAVVARASQFIGVHEDAAHTNHGAQVVVWLNRAGASAGDSWCMAFVYCMFDDCQYTTANGVTLVSRTASCQAQADHAKASGILVSADAARTKLQPGWIMLQWHTNPLGYHHTGIVTDYDPKTGIFHTVEGNTNTDGSREGYEVAKQARHIADTVGGRARYAFIQTS